MKILLTAALGIFAGSALAKIPDIPQYKFSFVVQSEHARLIRIDAALPLGTTQVFQATDHLRIEVRVPDTNTSASQTDVMLFNDSNGKSALLHSAKTSGSIAVSREYLYLVCQQQATFFSGLPADAPECPN